MRRKTLKRYLFGFVLVVAIAATTYLWQNRQQTLIDLQKDYLFAKTDAEREKVIDRLEEYYLNLSIPDSIHLHVNEKVGTLLETTEINVAEFSKENWDTTNVYELENQLKSLLKTAMIARARDEEQTFYALIELAKKMAKRVDEDTQADYWVSMVNEVSVFTNEKAASWLKIETASGLCYKYHAQPQHWEAGENFGSLGLQSSRNINDLRLRLDLMQRLQVILYYFRGMHDLSVAIADRSLTLADSIKYILRANGIAYQQAEALYEAGQINKALNLFQKVRKNSEKYHLIPSMSWYKIRALRFTADCYWQLGQYGEALSICDSVEQLQLTPDEEMQLHNTKGLIHRSLGNYETAELEYKKALKLAESANLNFNKIRFMNNLGFLYSLLTEHDRSLKYYYEAKKLLEEFTPDDFEHKINLIVNIAQVMVRQGRFESIDELITEAIYLSRLVNLPGKKADLLNTIGEFNLSLQKNQLAKNNFQEVLSISKNNGLIALGLIAQINLAESFIRLSKFASARKELIEANTIAMQINDAERITDSIAKLAKLEKSSGNLEKAIKTSKLLIPEIEKIFSHFNNENRMISFLQKIYDHLKEAVIYELQSGQAERAYALLDYAKGRSLKKANSFGNGHLESNSNAFHFNNIDKLKSRLTTDNLVIDYLVTDDTLYAFVLDHKELQVLRKSIKMDKLKALVQDYKKAINYTMTVFDPYDQNLVQSHFDSTSQLSQKLFENLFDWPELISRLKDSKYVYIIPDEFLYDLPFATLIENKRDKLTFLAQKTAIINLPSASFIQSADLEKSELSSKLKKILISADHEIPGAKDFEDFIMRLFPQAEVLTVNKLPFDKKDVLEKLNQGHDIYIFLGHGEANTQYPELSFIELTAKNIDSSVIEKIQITMDDLKELKWPGAEMVLLIGCETAGGKTYRGTGIAGLHQKFVSLGAKNVLASLWKIDARVAIPQIRSFIDYLLTDSDPIMALKKIQNNAIETFSKDEYYKFPHPYFWGSYILVTIEK